MSSAQDPFYIVKDEIQDSIDKLQSTFHQWEHIPVASTEQSRLTKELLSNCDINHWQVDELDKAISVAARDHSLYGINQLELEKHRKWTSTARVQVGNVKKPAGAILHRRGQPGRGNIAPAWATRQGQYCTGNMFVIIAGKVILEAVILIAVVVVSLTLFTFWAAKRGYDFNFLDSFLFGAIMVLMVFALIQAFFPLGRISVMIYGCLAAIIFCGYIVYDTNNLIKRYTYDEYIWAAVALYLDIINLFMALIKRSPSSELLTIRSKC